MLKAEQSKRLVTSFVLGSMAIFIGLEVAKVLLDILEGALFSLAVYDHPAYASRLIAPPSAVELGSVMFWLALRTWFLDWKNSSSPNNNTFWSEHFFPVVAVYACYFSFTQPTTEAFHITIKNTDDSIFMEYVFGLLRSTVMLLPVFAYYAYSLVNNRMAVTFRFLPLVHAMYALRLSLLSALLLFFILAISFLSLSIRQGAGATLSLGGFLDVNILFLVYSVYLLTLSKGADFTNDAVRSNFLAVLILNLWLYIFAILLLPR